MALLTNYPDEMWAQPVASNVATSPLSEQGIQDYVAATQAAANVGTGGGGIAKPTVGEGGSTSTPGVTMANAGKYLSGVLQGTPDQLSAARKLYYESGPNVEGSFQATRNAGGAGGVTGNTLPSQTRQVAPSNWLTDTSGIYMQDPTGQDSSTGTSYGLRPEQYATKEGALKIAEMLGLGPDALMSTRLGQSGGPFSGPEQWHILINGTPHAAGLLANQMSKQPAYQVRNALGLPQEAGAPTGMKPRNYGSGSRAALSAWSPATGHAPITANPVMSTPYGGYGGYGMPQQQNWLGGGGDINGLGQLLALLGGYGGGMGGFGGYGGYGGYGYGYGAGSPFGGGYGGYSPYRGYLSNLLYPRFG